MCEGVFFVYPKSSMNQLFLEQLYCLSLLLYVRAWCEDVLAFTVWKPRKNGPNKIQNSIPVILKQLKSQFWFTGHPTFNAKRRFTDHILHEFVLLLQGPSIQIFASIPYGLFTGASFFPSLPNSLATLTIWISGLGQSQMSERSLIFYFKIGHFQHSSDQPV